MGFFSSKTKITVDSFAFQLTHAAKNAASDAVLQSILKGSSVANGLLNTTLNGMSNKVDKMRSYARNHYTLGLPKGSHHSIPILNDEELADVIALDIGATHGVVVDYNTINPLVPFYLVLPHLTVTRDWDMVRDLVNIHPPGVVLPPPFDGTHTPTHKVNVESIELNSNNTAIVITYRVRSTYSSLVATGPGQDRTYEWQTIEYASSTVTENYPIPAGHHFGDDYCIASYKILDSEGSPGETLNWWYYRLSSGVYPELSKSENLTETAESLPVIPIRYNNQDMTRTDVQDTDLYKTSKKLLKKVGINIDDVASSINENPDVNEIDHAYIMFGIDLQTEENASIRFLTEFFDYLADISQVSLLKNIKSVYSNTTPPKDAYSFNDIATKANVASLIEHGLNVSIGYSYISSGLRVGSIGKIGTATMQKIRQSASDDNLSNRNNYNRSVLDKSILKLRLQITDNVYKEVTVKGLVHYNDIYQNHGNTTTLTEIIDNPDDHNFIIPIHYNVARKLPPLVKNALYEESLCLVMNSIVFTKIAWYETGIFRMLVMVVAIVITVWTGGAASWLTAFDAAIAAGATALLSFIFVNVLTALGLKLATSWVAELVGPEWAAVLAIVAAVAAMYASTNTGITLFGQDITTAEMFMSAAYSLAAAAPGEYSRQIEDITREHTDFLLEAEGKMEKLEEMKELLKSPNLLDWNLMDAFNHRFRPHPSSGDPTLFYNMCLLQNPGVLTLEVVSTYFDIALSLPEPDTMLS